MFLPVMRGTLSYPSGRDPDVLERLQPTHMINICSRLQTHFNANATRVASDQAIITMKVKEVSVFFSTPTKVGQTRQIK
jgi:BLOC-1 related complex subunit 5